MGRPKLYATRFKNLKRTTKRANRPGTEYYGDFTIKKKRFYPPLGADEDIAREELVKIMRETRERLEVDANPPKKLSQLQEIYRKNHTERSNETLMRTWTTRDNNAVGGLQDLPLKKITTNMIEEWLAKRREVRTAATVNGDLIRLSQVLDYAVKRRWLRSNPAKGIKYYDTPEVRVRYLTDEEETRLKAVCTPEQWDWVRFAHLTGLREGEQLKLRWSQIANDRINLEGVDTKSKRRRVVPIGEPVKEILDRRRDITKRFIWPSPRGKVWCPNNFRERFWRPLFDAAELVDFRWHDLRHTFCSRLVMAGKSLVAVRELAGHRRFETTLQYAHLAPSHLRETIDVLE